MGQSQDNIQRLYDKTNDGLEIICDYCEEAREAANSSEPQRHMFCYSKENTPSAHLIKRNGRWNIKDFSSGEFMDPIQVYANAESLNRSSDFNKIMKFLCQKYLGDNGVNTISESNRAVWDDPVPAPSDMQEGEYRWSDPRPLNATERLIMGKYVTEQACKDLQWYSIERYGRCKEGKVRWCHATEKYPIFIRKCTVFKDGKETCFWKKYEPLNPDKGFRFLTFDNDKVKPADYINNLYEFNQEYVKAQGAEEEDKLEFFNKGVVFCCGERDSLTCLSMGYWPLWLNSETATISQTQMRQIRKYNSQLPIYYIPDLDETGQKFKNKLANQFPDLWVVELPADLKSRKDNRGKPMKDLRDWVESTPDMDRYKFSALINTATRVKFWDIKYTKNGDKRISIDSDCLHFFLRTNGIEPVRDEDIEGDVEFGHHVNDYTIEAFNSKDVTDYVLSWAQKNLLPREVKNALLDGVKLDESKLMKMVASSYNFVHHDINSQTIFFRDTLAVISEKGIELFKEKEAAKTMKSKVWKKSRIDRLFRFITHEEERPLVNKYGKPVLDEEGKQRIMIQSVRTKLFHYNIKKEDGQNIIDIEINPEAYKSPAFKVLCATSHIYWQSEQARLEAENKSKEEIAEHWKNNWYVLDSPLLTPSQIYEQKCSLVSKLFIIGYYGWDFNSPSTPWAAFIMDDFDGEGSNGGSGKSLIFSYIDQYKSVEVLDGRRKENSKDKHIFAGVNSRTRVILFDDFWGSFSDWYQPITSGVRVERKGVDAFTIPPEKSPKLAFTTNGIGDTQQSSLRRQIRCTCSNFFHTEGQQFSETVAPSDFVGTLWDINYTDEKWRYDDNIFLECIEEAIPWIKKGIKLEPPMARVELRSLRNKIGKANIEFFDEYFRPGELSHADKFLDKKTFIEDYRRSVSSKSDYVTDTNLMERLAMWVAYRSWALAFCPKGINGWCGDIKNQYRKARIIQNGVEGIYIATTANNDPKLQYLKERIDEKQSAIQAAEDEEEQIRKAVEKLADPALANQPL